MEKTFGFDEIFDLDSNGTPTLKRTLVVADIPLTPGMRWQPGFRFAGWDVAEHMGKPVVARDEGEYLRFVRFEVGAI